MSSNLMSPDSRIEAQHIACARARFRAEGGATTPPGASRRGPDPEPREGEGKESAAGSSKLKMGLARPSTPHTHVPDERVVHWRRHAPAHDAEGQMSVTTAPHARMSLTTEPTRWTGGKTQLFSTPHWRERASVHFASARGWKYWEQKRPASQQLSADAKRSKV